LVRHEAALQAPASPRDLMTPSTSPKIIIADTHDVSRQT